jgi:hypothetical protein
MMHVCKLLGITLLSTALQVSAAEKAQEISNLLLSTDRVSAAAGIGKLRDFSLAENEQEIRIWIGFGTTRVNRMLQLKVDPSGKVHGEVFVHYKNNLRGMSDGDAAEFRRSVLVGCTNPKEGSEANVCTATFQREPDWQFTYGKLVELGALDLPDESALPPPTVEVTDGSAMVVELRNGSRYRAYQYLNSWIREEPEAIAATRIMQGVSKTIAAGR